MSHSIGQFGPFPDLKGILDDLGKDQHLHRARQFRERDERMWVLSTFLGVQQSLQMLATDSVAIWMSPGCEPSSVLGFFPQSSETLAFFGIVDPHWVNVQRPFVVAATRLWPGGMRFWDCARKVIRHTP